MATGPALAVENLSLGYNGKAVLADVHFVVPSGARVAVVGPNGAGKSTLFKGLVGLLPLRSGRADFEGRALADQLRRIAYVPQREEVDWSFPVSALDVVLMGRYGHLGWGRRPGAADRAFAMRLLEQLGLTALAQHPIGELSGGQQQRLFLARALAQEPSLLLLDEPFAGVDEPTQRALLDLLAGLAASSATLLVSTHDLDLAASHFDLVLLLNGRVVAFGPPTEVLTTETLLAAFGAPSFPLGEGRLLSLTNSCCPPPRSSRHHADGRPHG
ncbi:MAG: metal ABC transporter ATP-binding protein [Chloroflexota bacterium]